MKVDPFRQNSWSRYANTLNGYEDPKAIATSHARYFFSCPNKFCAVVELVPGSLFIFHVRLSSAFPRIPRLHLTACGAEHFSYTFVNVLISKHG